MRLLILTLLAMVAFAGNSLLNRWAVGGGHADPYAFAAIRVASGAVVLLALVAWQRRRLHWAGGRSVLAVAGLATYMLGFSAAYRQLDAGAGALVLFAMVQVTMFAGALLARERFPPTRVLGGGLAFAGLCWLLWPGSGGLPGPSAALPMLAAGIGWGVYSLTGRHAGDPLAATATNFALCLPLMLLALPLGAQATDATGVAVAIGAGALTSGLGYALWFSVLPGLGATRAAVWQLTVPVIALAGGFALLGETPAPSVLIAAVVVLGGVTLALRR